MADNPENGPDLPIGELREVTLLIPGEHFFCETFSLPPSTESDSIQDIALQALEVEGFSPYPLDQLAWGFFASPESEKIIVFATPFAKLRQLGWQNLEVFRRVFPSFASFFGKVFDKPTVVFLLHEETLSIASFEEDCSVPESIFSLPVETNTKDSFEVARGKLLSLVNLEHYEVQSDVLVLEDVIRTNDGFFHFEHEWMEGKNPELELDQNVVLSGDELWNVDLRPIHFKETERKRRKQSRLRWRAMLISTIGLAALLLLFAGVNFLDGYLLDKKRISGEMFAEVPLVRESQKLLEKLRQNKLGGIDPFGALGRVAIHRGGQADDPGVWFSLAHFESRNEVKLEGEGKNVEAVNNFIEKLEGNNIASMRKGRTGKELREINSGGGKTTFEIELDLYEVSEKQASSIAEDSSGIEKEG